MIVRLTAAGAVVRDADDCTVLHLDTVLRGPKLRAALTTTDTGEVAKDGTVWLDLAVLRTRAKLLASAPDWRDRWARMIDDARRESRISQDGRSIRVSARGAASTD